MTSGLPRWLYLPALLGGLFLLLPLVAMVGRVDVRHFGSLITSQAALDARRSWLEQVERAARES